MKPADVQNTVGCICSLKRLLSLSLNVGYLAFFRHSQSGRYPSSSGLLGLRQPNDEAPFSCAQRSLGPRFYVEPPQAVSSQVKQLIHRVFHTIG